MRFNGYYRLILPLGELAKHGHEVTLVNYLEEGTANALRTASEYDLVVAERLHKYEGIGAWRKARTKDNRLVFENDDNIFNVSVENWTAYNLYKQEDVREAVAAYCEWADLLTVTTEPLAEVFREHNPNVKVLQNCLPDVAYEVLSQSYRGECLNGPRKLRVGWVGGASHGRDIHTATSAVRRFITRNKDWQLYLGGNDYRPTFRVPVDRVHYEPWHKITEETDLFYSAIDFDIGIAPVLESDFARSKSALKAIEYGARGIPVIASDVTCYRDYVVHGYNGFLVKTEHEWIKYLNELASDPKLRRIMGANNYAMADQYRINNRWTEWEDAYKRMWKVKA